MSTLDQKVQRFVKDLGVHVQFKVSSRGQITCRTLGEEATGATLEDAFSECCAKVVESLKTDRDKHALQHDYAVFRASRVEAILS